jgi:hypothetical protein
MHREDTIHTTAVRLPVLARKRAKIRKDVHKPFCFGGQTAACQGYFENDMLPCVCGGTGSALSALEQVQVPLGVFAEAGCGGGA